MVHFWDSDVWSWMLLFAVLTGSLLVGNTLRRKIPLLRSSLIPTSVIGGAVLLIVEAIYKAITGNVTYYAIWNEVVNIKELLETLLSDYSLNPFGYIPESMNFNYSDNLINPGDIADDYSAAVSVSDITYGFGEQWQMVLDNIMQSEVFFDVLST